MDSGAPIWNNHESVQKEAHAVLKQACLYIAMQEIISNSKILKYT
jgi:hypothetical protein